MVKLSADVSKQTQHSSYYLQPAELRPQFSLSCSFLLREFCKTLMKALKNNPKLKRPDM